jgi:3-deoxy-D-manno-octulosonate 8-phosphate phosphatase (KDO 8-P phosphatase)
VKQKLAKIKVLLFDVDGVLTTGNITYTDAGHEIKSFNVQDGMGITLARLAGLKTGIITGRKSKIVERRAKELKVDFLSQGRFNKLPAYQKIVSENGLDHSEICYIGDDILDLVILNRVGFSVAVANAREEVKAECDYITVATGGNGAVREVVDMILKRQGKFNVLLESLINPGDA